MALHLLRETMRLHLLDSGARLDMIDSYLSRWDTALESDISGWATDLQGRRHALAFRELRIPGFVDQVAVLEVQAPDTLHFHLTVTPRGHGPKQLDFVREFHPR